MAKVCADLLIGAVGALTLAALCRLVSHSLGYDPDVTAAWFAVGGLGALTAWRSGG